LVRRNRLLLAALGVVVLLLTSWAAVAPPERTLGTGIRVVYVHVGLTWAGMIGLGLAAFLGLLTFLQPEASEPFWLRALGWTGLGFFAAGLLMSLPAAQLNWGGLFFQEPRTLSALRFLALGLIVQILMDWPLPRRFKGLLWVGMGGVLAWTVLATPLILHPQSAVRTSDSAAIQGSFLGITALCLLAGALLIGLWRTRQPA
jgi:hypothetical protein